MCEALCLTLVSQVLLLLGGLAEMQRLTEVSILNRSIFLPILREPLTGSLVPILREPTVNHPYQHLQNFKSISLQTLSCWYRTL